MRRILVVDDEPIITDGIADMLQEEGIRDLEVYRCYSAREALGLLDRVRADIVLTDIKMPEMDGMGLFEEIRKRWPACRVIFLTGYEDFQSLYQASRYKTVRYLLKSEGPDQVLRTVEEVLAELETEQKEQLAEPDFAREASGILKIDVIRSILDGQFPASGTELDKRLPGIRLNVDFEKPFYLLLGTVSSEMGSYFEFLRCFFRLRKLFERHLSSFCVFEQIYYDWLTMAWVLQSGDLERLSMHLPGVLEMLQTDAEALLGIHIGFLFNRRATITPNAPQELPRLKGMLGMAGGLCGKIVLADPADSGGARGQGACAIRCGQIEILRMMLEQNQRDSFLALFVPLVKPIRNLSGKHHPQARECYRRLADMLLSHISRRDLTERIAFLVATEGLNSSTDHADWDRAMEYLREVAEAIFELQTTDGSSELSQLFHKIDHYIDNNLDGELSLTRISEMVHFNPTYLSRIFKEAFHVSLSEYISEKRLTMAKKLLLSTELKIQDICERTGNYSSTNFCRFFKKATGFTPQEYRKQFSVDK